MQCGKVLNDWKILKGARCLLLCKGKDVLDEYCKLDIDNVLALNKPLAEGYYLKESIK